MGHFLNIGISSYRSGSIPRITYEYLGELGGEIRLYKYLNIKSSNGTYLFQSNIAIGLLCICTFASEASSSGSSITEFPFR